MVIGEGDRTLVACLINDCNAAHTVGMIHILAREGVNKGVIGIKALRYRLGDTILHVADRRTVKVAVFRCNRKLAVCGEELFVLNIVVIK